jgi:hypothetical protein
LLGGKPAEAQVLYRITGEIDPRRTEGRLSGSHIEFSSKASEALARVRRLTVGGYLNVRAVDTATGEPCDEACLRRAAQAEGR